MPKSFIAVLKRDQQDHETNCGTFAAGTLGTITMQWLPGDTDILWFFNPQGTNFDFGFYMESNDFLELAYVGNFSIVEGVIQNAIST